MRIHLHNSHIRQYSLFDACAPHRHKPRFSRRWQRCRRDCDSSIQCSENRFDKIHEEVYGKTGCRRIVPGQYLAADPRGRAVMISAIEKQKFVYVLNRDSTAKLLISSPLEAHAKNTICLATAGLDVEFENPRFCMLGNQLRRS
eukprot:GABV01003395.1.p1 GENE.GABV01003395.1~~GABV01003395.1.p1  ORF type:complete len:144 (-),score=38.19 GABV01003395.1:28-459(-)